MPTLPAPESERLEEHLLTCSECRDRLESTDEYVAAAGKIRRGKASRGVDARRR
jgi:anti-sigma factor RsiW